MLVVNLDMGGILPLGDLSDSVRKALQEAAKNLSVMAYAKAVELANQKLHSRRQMFIEALTYKAIDEDTYIIHLDGKAGWIDDGLEEFDMKPGLLKSSKAKTAKDGSKYLSVPFDHSKGGVSKPQAQNDLVSTVKSQMKAKGIPMGIEKDSQGQPKLGKLHSFDIMKEPVKTHNGPNQGKGPVGAVKQGSTGIPWLQGIQVYQTKTKSGKVQKSIMTFRTVSSKQGPDKWMHPKSEGAHIFQETYEWALSEWERMIPTILEKL